MFKKIVAVAVLAMTLTIGTSPLWAMSGTMDNYTTVEKRGGHGGHHGGGHGGGHR